MLKTSPEPLNHNGTLNTDITFYRFYKCLSRRPRSPTRSNTDPRFMHSTVSFRAKSPTRQKRKSKKKKIPFLTGNDTDNVAPFNYTKEHIKGILKGGIPLINIHVYVSAIEEDEQLIDEISDELTTYEQIRKRITRLLESPRAREINRDVSMTHI